MKPVYFFKMVFKTLFCSFLAIASSQNILSSPRITNYGDWGHWDRCPNGSYVYGMRLKTEPVQGPLDDTALNGIQFLCGNRDSSGLMVEDKGIRSLQGYWGTWGLIYECGDYATGFQLRSELPQGDGDDSAANNLRLICSDSNKFVQGGGLNWGEWTSVQTCPKGQAMCALRTQVEMAQGTSIDDTSLNNLDVECCDL